MREIKFMLGITDPNDGNKPKLYGSFDIKVVSKVIGMRPWEVIYQYTGLKDCTGKDIYEGDIVRTWNGNVSFISHEDGYYRIGKGKRVVAFHEWRTFEVKGNIYVNPELLEGK